MEKIRYNHLNSYLKELFGERVLKVCIDGGFSCPNRVDGSGGCIFCSASGAGENIKGKLEDREKSIVNQIETFLNSYRGERANKFIAYFQAYSNTFDSVENLKRIYDLALSTSDKFVGLEISTRPDLISDEVVELLKSYKDKYYVCVELGFQTANDEVGVIINRKYTTRDFIESCRKLKSAGIAVVAHLMVGLPFEKENDVLDTVKIINNSSCDGIKIHSTYVLPNTKLESFLNSGEYTCITQDKYVECVGKIISHLNPNIIIHRITADPPKDAVAPLWTTHKKLVLNAITKYLAEQDLYQGQDYLK